MNVVGGVKETTRGAPAEVPREKRVVDAASDSSGKARAVRGRGSL